MKVEALRQAQLDLLRGKVVAKPDKNDPDAGTSYAQSYYWAPAVQLRAAPQLAGLPHANQFRQQFGERVSTPKLNRETPVMNG